MAQKNIGILTPVIEGFYFGGLIDSIYNVARAQGARVFVIQTSHFSPAFNPDKTAQYNLPLAYDYIDGWIVLIQAIESEYLNKLCNLGKPVAMISRELENDKCQYVLSDNIGGMKAAVTHLIGHGHRDIAFVGCMNQFDIRQRYEGYAAALKEHGLLLNPDWVINVPDNMHEGGHYAAQKLLDLQMPCTAIAAACDFNALGVMDKLLDAGYRIPYDVALIGYDNVNLGKTATPSLSSVHQDIYDIGGEAARVILRQINGENLPDKMFYVKTSLVIRQSCGCPENEFTTTVPFPRDENKHKEESKNKESLINKKIIDYLVGVIRSNYAIGYNLMGANLGEIKSLSWLQSTSFHWACLGLWDRIEGRHKELVVEQFFNSKEDYLSPLGIRCSPSHFPPIQFLPESTLQGEDLVWLHPIETEMRSWGVLALVGPVVKERLLISVDSMTHCFDMLAFALEREALSENKYRNLLNNAQQGFLTFGSNLVIDNEYSQECKKIFNQDIAGKVFSSLFFPHDKEQQKFLECISRDILMEPDCYKVKMYLDLLPREFEINKRHIQVEYKLTDDFSKNNQKRMMLVLTDITDKRKLENEMEYERNILKMVVKAAVSYNEFMDYVKDYSVFCKNTLFEILDSEQSLSDIYAEIYRYIHTFKGNFSQLDMVNVVNDLHRFETRLSEIKKDLNKYTVNQFKDFIYKYNMIEWAEKDLSILKDILGEQYFNMDNILVINEDDLKEIENKAISTLSAMDCRTFLSELRKLRYKPFKDLLKTYPEYTQKLSERLKKTIYSIRIKSGADIQVDTDRYHDFAKSLVHVFRNSVDHGIEAPDERIEAGKDEYGTISCEIELVDNQICLTISDDGRGIDIPKIREKALLMGIYDNESIEAVSDDDLTRLIFNEEFSTKDIVTSLSGRGVGLPAIKSEVLKLGGSIEVKSKMKEGTSFIFYLPYQKINDMLTVSVTNILTPVLKTAKKLFHANFNFTLNSCSDFKITRDRKVVLNDVSAFINVKGVINSTLILSVDETLARNMVKVFLLEEVPPECESEYMEDVLAECLNTVLGNSIEFLGSIEDLVALETPVTFYSKNGCIKYGESEICSCSIHFEQGNMTLTFISSSGCTY